MPTFTRAHLTEAIRRGGESDRRCGACGVTYGHTSECPVYEAERSLRAAAADLYAVARMALRKLGGRNVMGSLCEPRAVARIQRALAKAEGRAP